MIPVLELVVGFRSTVYGRSALPFPLLLVQAPLIQLALLLADHAQLSGAVTVIEPVPPIAGKEADVGEMLETHDDVEEETDCDGADGESPQALATTAATTAGNRVACH